MSITGELVSGRGQATVTFLLAGERFLTLALWSSLLLIFVLSLTAGYVGYRENG